MTILTVIILLCIILILLGLLESYRECKDFNITHYKISHSKLCSEGNHHKTRKVIMLSDLHNKEYGENNIELLNAIKNEAPDFILIAGDMLIGKEGIPTNKAKCFMKEVSKIAPVYYGNGNHEQRLRDYPEFYGDIYGDFKRELISAGVIFLENENTELMLGDTEITVTAFEIPSRFYEKFNNHKLEMNEIETTIGKAREKYQILIAHHPKFANLYSKWGADLVLSGHLHGGIIRLPFIGAMITPQVHLLPRYSGGHYQYENSDIVVSKGLGEHTIKLRFLNKPEVIVLHFELDDI